jgi:hypothetical protein
MKCRYDDCINYDGSALYDDDLITCPLCRDNLGLPKLDHNMKHMDKTEYDLLLNKLAEEFLDKDFGWDDTYRNWFLDPESDLDYTILQDDLNFVARPYTKNMNEEFTLNIIRNSDNIIAAINGRYRKHDAVDIAETCFIGDIENEIYNIVGKPKDLSVYERNF